MRKDNAFLGLKSNPFRHYFNFTERGDTFLILPSLAYAGVGALKKKKKGKATKGPKGKSEDKITIPIESSILKKIKKCEAAIEEEWDKNGDKQAASYGILRNVPTFHEHMSPSQIKNKGGQSPGKSPQRKKTIQD
jgi:hypothetical protein